MPQTTNPAPIAHLCRASASLLVVVDIQERLAAAIPAKVINRIVRNTALLTRAGALLEIPLLATVQYPRGLGPLLPEIAAWLPTPFEKTAFSCRAAPGFLDALAASGRTQILLTGMEAHVCVLQTAFDLADLGHDVRIVEDAICSRKLENYENALRRLQHRGIPTLTMESVLFEWLRDAAHPHFKTVSGWLKDTPS